MTRPIRFRAWNKTNGHMVPWDEVNDFRIYLESPHHILMQYTGLLDKNGTPIYEGDVLDVPDSSKPSK